MQVAAILCTRSQEQPQYDTTATLQ